MNLLILVVDDEPDVEVLFRQQFRRDLRAGRFTMEFAQSAPMALQRITDAGDRSLILILSDINMPGMSGLELLPKARATRPDVPIIMITAYGDAETKRKALENGAVALLTKPIDFATLRNEIDIRVERAQRVGPRCGKLRSGSKNSACPSTRSALLRTGLTLRSSPTSRIKTSRRLVSCSAIAANAARDSRTQRGRERPAESRASGCHIRYTARCRRASPSDRDVLRPSWFDRTRGSNGP